MKYYLEKILKLKFYSLSIKGHSKTIKMPCFMNHLIYFVVKCIYRKFTIDISEGKNKTTSLTQILEKSLNL